ncbi:hypothetical protein LDENG_00190130 [Lucifuga dentata]|nr:hypothetical protein LDENG_00190130 [Lucifuga dentata]
MRPLNQSRCTNGEFASLVLAMREMDDATHFDYFRMSVGMFDDLLCRVGPLITHENTHTWPISAAECLSITLRFLAMGISFRVLSQSCKLGAATVSCIIGEMFKAIWNALKDDYVAFPNEEKWENIKRDF